MSKNKEYKVEYTLNHTGKMTGMGSVSTSCDCNPVCQARMQIAKSEKEQGVNQKFKIICIDCYAYKQMMRYPSLEKKCERNDVLYKELLAPEDFPPIDADKFPYFRIESFGDIQNDIQAKNYITLIRSNPKVKFAWFTKNPAFIADAIEHGYSIPKNVSIVLSSLRVNKPDATEVDIKTKYPFVDHLFTVYTPEYIEEENIDINCGARSCFKCNRCYHKNTEFQVREKIK